MEIGAEVELSDPRTYAKWDGASHEELLRDWMILTSVLLVGGRVASNVRNLQRAIPKCPVVTDPEARDTVRKAIGFDAGVGMP